MIQSYSTIIFAFWKIVCPAPFISFIASTYLSPLLNSFYPSHKCTPPSHPKKVIGVKWLQIPQPTYAATHITLCHPLATTQWLPLLKTKTTRSPFKPRPRQRGDSRRLRRFESETWLKMTVKNHNTVVNVNTGQRVNGRGKPCSDTTLTHYLVKHILCSNEHNPGRSKGTYPNLPQNSTFADCVKVIWRNPAVENDMISHTLMGFSLREKTLNCRVQRPRSSLSGCRGVLF